MNAQNNTVSDEIKSFVRENIAIGFDPYYRDQVLKQLRFLLSTDPTDAYLFKRHEQLCTRLKIAIAESAPTAKIVIEREAVRLAHLYKQHNKKREVEDGSGQ